MADQIELVIREAGRIVARFPLTTETTLLYEQYGAGGGMDGNASAIGGSGGGGGLGSADSNSGTLGEAGAINGQLELTNDLPRSICFSMRWLDGRGGDYIHLSREDATGIRDILNCYLQETPNA